MSILATKCRYWSAFHFLFSVIFAIALILVIHLPMHANSAEIVVEDIELNGRDKGKYHNEIIKLRLSGEIESGDANKLRQVLTNTLPDYYPNAISSITIEMSSKGGSFLEGVELMKTMKELAISTLVRKDSECLSACAIAFLGGTIVNEASIYERSRNIEPGASLGFHAPSLNVDSKQLIPADLMQEAYQQALLALGSLIRESKSYEISPTLLEKIAETPPDSIYVLKFVDDFARWKIGVHLDEKNWKPDNDDIARICSNFFIWETGGSIFQHEANILRENPSYNRRKQQKQLAQSIRYVRSNGRIRTEYAHVQTLAYEYDEYCIVELTPWSDEWSIGVQKTNSTPSSAIEARRTANIGLPRASRLHALPADFDISKLK